MCTEILPSRELDESIPNFELQTHGKTDPLWRHLCEIEKLPKIRMVDKTSKECREMLPIAMFLVVQFWIVLSNLTPEVFDPQNLQIRVMEILSGFTSLCNKAKLGETNKHTITLVIKLCLSLAQKYTIQPIKLALLYNNISSEFNALIVISKENNRI